MTAPASTAQHSTPAVVSELPLATIRDIVATLQAAFPAEHARIARCVEVLLSSKIVETGTLGRYLVQSTADGLLYYEATSWTCSCPDARRHSDEGLRCKQSWALDILSVASAIASRETKEAAAVAASQDADILDVGPDAPIPFELTPQAMATLDPTACSVCGHDLAEHDGARCGGCPEGHCQPDRARVLA
jgi:hypothetical protein